MPKRKRDDDTPKGVSMSKSSKVRQQNTQHKVQRASVKIRHAIKVAKGFERQKLGRRRKNAVAKNDGKDVERIDSEIVALKTLDNTACAQQLLCKSLLKSKSFSEHPDVPAEIKQQGPISKDVATLNVNARLCKANQVQDALTPAVREIYLALGVEVEKMAAPKKRRLRAKDFGDAQVKGDEVRTDLRARQIDSSKLDEQELPQEESVGIQSEDEDASFGMGSRVAISSDSTEDISDIDELEQRLAREGIQRRPLARHSLNYDLRADLSISGSESDSAPHSPSPEPQKAPTTARKSSFIPSLTMGGYISGSGSDIDENDEVDVAPERKNRRGQRARRQIWEQKYGWNAKHLRSEGGRDGGWDARRGATDGSERRGGFHQRGVRRASPDYSVGARFEPGGSKGGSERKERKERKEERDDAGAIHPSWEAAKRAKERKEVPVAFQGKKITFD